MTQIFVSHSHRDRPLVDLLKNLIEDVSENSITLAISSDISGLDGFELGEYWKDWREEQIKKSNAMIVVITPYSIECSWLMMEIGFAKANSKTIIPILFKTQVPSALNNSQAVQGDNKSGIQLVLKQLGDFNITTTQYNNYVSEYLQNVKELLKKYPKEFTQDELIAIIVGPLGLALKKGLDFLRQPILRQKR